MISSEENVVLFSNPFNDHPGHRRQKRKICNTLTYLRVYWVVKTQHEHMYESSNVYLLDPIVVFIVHKIMHMQSLVRFLHTVIISEHKITFQYFFSKFDSPTSLIIWHQVLISNSAESINIYLTPAFLS